MKRAYIFSITSFIASLTTIFSTLWLISQQQQKIDKLESSIIQLTNTSSEYIWWDKIIHGLQIGDLKEIIHELQQTKPGEEYVSSEKFRHFITHYEKLIDIVDEIAGVQRAFYNTLIQPRISKS